MDWDFAVPAGWQYAQAPEFTIAVSDTATLAVGVTAEKSKEEKPKKDPKALDPKEATLRELIEKSSIVLPKRRAFLARKPDKVEQTGELKMSFYQFEGAKRDQLKGTALVVTGDLPESRTLVGLGFVADDDKSNSDEAIMQSLGSLSRASTSSSAGQDTPSTATTSGQEAPQSTQASPANNPPPATAASAATPAP